MALEFSVAHQAQNVGSDMRRRERGDVTVVIGWCDFDHVGADQIDVAQPTHDCKCLRRTQPSRDGRAGTRREGGIEAVDIER